jgi:hypothetical protein
MRGLVFYDFKWKSQKLSMADQKECELNEFPLNWKGLWKKEDILEIIKLLGTQRGWLNSLDTNF